METNFKQEPVKEETEKGYIKLYKNSRGYNWEIKAYEGMNQEEFKLLLKKIKELNTEIEMEFSNE